MASELYLGGNAADGTPIAAVKTVPINPATGAAITPVTQDTGANRVVLYDAAGNAIKTLASAGPVVADRGVLVDARLWALDANNGTYGQLKVVSFNRLLTTPLGTAATTDAMTTASTVDQNVNPALIGVGLSAFNGATSDRIRIAAFVQNIAAQAVTAGVPVTIRTPAAGKKWRVLGFALSLTVAGSIIIKDAGTERFRTPLLVANTGFQFENMGMGVLSAAANNTLQVDASASGSISGFILGVEE